MRAMQKSKYIYAPGVGRDVGNVLWERSGRNKARAVTIRGNILKEKNPHIAIVKEMRLFPGVDG